MTDEVLIRAQNVGKQFVQHHRRATSLKELLVKRERGVKESFWALRDVNLVIHRGETVGLIGPNGSGKSTLLKVLSGILRTSTGSVSVTGRVASLLELGAGFDGELTGRENVYLNSALLGVPRSETDRLFEDILEFSELGEFIDFPVKHYSSGMYVRLGFSVAVHIDPDILIVDEVLAVGDAAFQQKCLNRITTFQDEGKTILFVSHSAPQIEQLCTRAVLLSRGRVIFDGTPVETIGRLNALLGIVHESPGASDVARVAAQLVDPGTGETPPTFQAGGAAVFVADIEWQVDTLPDPTHAELTFVVGDDVVASVQPLRHLLSRDEPMLSGGTTRLRWQIPAMPPLNGEASARLTLVHDDAELAAGEVGPIRSFSSEQLIVPGQVSSFGSTDEH